MTRPAAISTLLLLLAVSCGGSVEESPASAGAAPRWAFEQEFPGGAHPVSLVLRLDRTSIGLADRVTLEEELRIEPGFEAEFPEYLPEDFEGFSVSDIERADTNERDGEAPATERRVLRKRLVLEPERSGELAIAPLAVYFHESGAAEESSFLTEPVTVDVEGISDIGAVTVRPMRDIFEEPPEEAPSHALLWTLGVAGGAVLLVAAVVLWRRRPRRAVPPVAAHEVAYEALRRLAALGLIEKGEIEMFFVYLSGILRRYIEDRFAVHAPERTTEEFLEEASRDPLLARRRDLLGEFLALSDQVKFARFEPDEAAIQRAFDVTKSFIGETRADAGGEGEHRPPATPVGAGAASTAGGAP